MVDLSLPVNSPAGCNGVTQQFFRAALLGSTDGIPPLNGTLQGQGGHTVAQNWPQKATGLGGPHAVNVLTRARDAPRCIETDPEHGGVG